VNEERLGYVEDEEWGFKERMNDNGVANLEAV